MALQFLNNCRWRATAGGLGSFVVASALIGGYTPAQCAEPAVTDGATYRYFAVSDDGTQHEEGTGVFATGTVTLTRATIRNSSNAGAAVNFSAAPQVLMGGPTADDMTLVRIGSFDITNDGPFASVDFALGSYAHHILVAKGLNVEVPGTGAINDALYVAVHMRDGGGNLGTNPIPVSGIYAAEHDGVQFTGTLAQSAIVDVLPGSYGTALAWRSMLVEQTENTITAFSGHSVDVTTYEHAAPPSTPTIIRVLGTFFDDSGGTYNAANMTAGTLELWGLASGI